MQGIMALKAFLHPEIVAIIATRYSDLVPYYCINGIPVSFNPTFDRYSIREKNTIIRGIDGDAVAAQVALTYSRVRRDCRSAHGKLDKYERARATIEIRLVHHWVFSNCVNFRIMLLIEGGRIRRELLTSYSVELT